MDHEEAVPDSLKDQCSSPPSSPVSRSPSTNSPTKSGGLSLASFAYPKKPPVHAVNEPAPLFKIHPRSADGLTDASPQVAPEHVDRMMHASRHWAVVMPTPLSPVSIPMPPLPA